MIRLTNIVDRFAAAKVLVVGDAMFDQYHHGEATRLSPEAPVPVFVQQSEERRPGGAANVAHNLMHLGCDAACVFPLMEEWSVKHRFMADGRMLLRVDEDRQASTPAVRRDLEKLFEEHRPTVVVISDYGKGFVTPMLVAKIVALCAGGDFPKIIVDPKGSSWLKYQGAEIITPNQKEFADWDGAYAPPFIIKKMGPLGLMLSETGKSEVAFPAIKSPVFDVTGAGDTVVATIAAALACHASMEDACRLAVLAAGFVVGQVGTATCPAPVLRSMAARIDP